jgi:hypothetical protein
MSTPTDDGTPFDDVIEPQDDALPRSKYEEHGGMPRVDDDVLARATQQERVDAGLADYVPDDVPSATDEPPTPVDITQTQEYQEELTEARRVAREQQTGGS